MPLPGPERGWRSRELEADWSGNRFVAIWEKGKWGLTDLSVYEIENDKLKRVHPVLAEARKYFDRDFKERFLKKYPKEADNYTFVSKGEQELKGHDFQFDDHRLVLDLFADNKPNLAPGPDWTASLRGVWNLDTAKFEKVDFRPSETSIRPENRSLSGRNLERGLKGMFHNPSPNEEALSSIRAAKSAKDARAVPYQISLGLIGNGSDAKFASTDVHFVKNFAPDRAPDWAIATASALS